MHSWEIKVKVLGEKGWGSSTHHQTNHPRKSRGRAINRWPPVSITVSPLTRGAKWKKKKVNSQNRTGFKNNKREAFLSSASFPSPSCCPYVVLIQASSGERQVCCLWELACREGCCDGVQSQFFQGPARQPFNEGTWWLSSLDHCVLFMQLALKGGSRGKIKAGAGAVLKTLPLRNREAWFCWCSLDFFLFLTNKQIKDQRVNTLPPIWILRRSTILGAEHAQPLAGHQESQLTQLLSQPERRKGKNSHTQKL